MVQSALRPIAVVAIGYLAQGEIVVPESFAVRMLSEVQPRFVGVAAPRDREAQDTGVKVDRPLEVRDVDVDVVDAR